MRQLKSVALMQNGHPLRSAAYGQRRVLEETGAEHVPGKDILLLVSICEHAFNRSR